MAVTININGLTLCHEDSGGVIKNTLPDVCKIPPNSIPKPFNITAFSKDLADGTTTVKVDGGNMAANLGSRFTKCTGDEGGTLVGLVSGTQLGESTWITYSPSVYLEGKAACRLTDKMFMNNGNCAGMAGLSQKELADLKKIMCKIVCEANARRDEYRNANSQKKPRSAKAQSIVDKAKKDGIVSKNGSFLGDKYASKLADTKYASSLKRFGLTQKYNALTKISKQTASLLKKSQVLTGGAARERMVRQIKNKIARVMARKAAKKAATIWLKAIPIVNVISTAYDVYDVVTTGSALYKELDAAKKAAEAIPDGHYTTSIPDFAKVDANGNVTDVVEMKIGHDSPGRGQIEKYTDLTDGKEPIQVSGKECGCPPAK